MIRCDKIADRSARCGSCACVGAQGGECGKNRKVTGMVRHEAICSHRVRIYDVCRRGVSSRVLCELVCCCGHGPDDMTTRNKMIHNRAGVMNPCVQNRDGVMNKMIQNRDGVMRRDTAAPKA